MKVNLHIERLVLDGLPISRLQGALVQRAVESELSRLMMEGGLAPQLHAGVALPSVRASNIEVSTIHHPTNLGQQIASAVYGGIGK
jgi:hypothetical protein